MTQNVVTMEAPKLPSIQSGNAVRPIVPNDFESAYRIANAVFKSGMAPNGIDTPEKAMIVIMHGMEVGMTPMMALQSIASINGRPSIYGDGALGLVQGSGLLEWHKEYYEGEEGKDSYKAVCEVKRRNDKEVKRGEFSIADAKLAKLFGKVGPWTQYLKRMLQMRARGFALRDGFSDVLRGLHIAEEAQDIIPVKDITPSREPPAPPSIEPPEPEVQDTVDNTIPDPKTNAPDPDSLLKFIDATLAAVTDPFNLSDVWEEKCLPKMEGMFPPDREEAEAIYGRHTKRLDP